MEIQYLRKIPNKNNFLSRDTGENINMYIFSVLFPAVFFFLNDQCLIQSQISPWSKNNGSVQDWSNFLN